MKRLKYPLLFLLIALIVAVILLYPKYKNIQHVIHLFDEDRIVENFRSFDKAWHTRDLRASDRPYVYAKAEEMELPTSFEYMGEVWDTEKFLGDSRTTGFLVIQDDSIVYEQYFLGNAEDTRNISWSMAKSFISALVGIAVEEGYIKSIQDPIDRYVPMLTGSAYDGVKIKDVLQMSTGVRFNEDYGDFNSDINRWGRGFALGGSQDKFATTLEREVEPGTVCHYVSINTHVLGMLLHRATGKTITEYMQEKLWTPAGMEHDAYWLIDGKGMEMALGGLNATLRDYAKIGSLFLNKGNWHGQQIVQADWVAASTYPDAPHVMPHPDHKYGYGYGYQWWIPKGTEGEYMAQGVYNQNVYINPTTRTVIAKLSANHRYNEGDFLPSQSTMALALYREIAHQFAGGSTHGVEEAAVLVE